MPNSGPTAGLSCPFAMWVLEPMLLPTTRFYSQWSQTGIRARSGAGRFASYVLGRQQPNDQEQ